MNTGAPWPDRDEAKRRVHAMQSKLHHWAVSDPGRQFDDLYNLVYDPAFLVVAWNRVKTNKGARSAGVDDIAPRSITAEGEFLTGLREELKARRFAPTRVREKMIPKTGGNVRRLGIPTAADRVVQSVVKLVIEPIFEADFKPCSYGFRPKRRAKDAIAEIHYLASPTRNYEWVFEADITAEALWDEVSTVLAPIGLRLSEEKTRVCHIDEGFDFLGFASSGESGEAGPASERSTPTHPRRPWPR